MFKLFPHFIPEDQLIVKKYVVYERTTGNLGSILCLKLVKIQLEREVTHHVDRDGQESSQVASRLSCNLEAGWSDESYKLQLKFYAKDDLLP